MSTRSMSPVQSDSGDSTSHYSSALENISGLTSLNESTNNNSNYISIANDSTKLDVTLANKSANDINQSSFKPNQRDSNDYSEEVDPKSQLANKTIFKTDNPNLSIIEISNCSTLENENSVYVLGSSSDECDVPNMNFLNENHRMKVEKRLQSSRQKLNGSSAISSTPISTMTKPFNQSSFSLTTSPTTPTNTEHQLTDTAKRNSIHVYNSIDEFEANLPPTVTVLTTPFGSKVYLVGTVHFSEESQDDVSYVIRNVRPDVVMVELCPSRIHILKLDDKTLLEEAKVFKLSKIRSIIQSNGYINGIFSILLLHMSAQLAKELGMAPGGEFRRAFEEIHKIPGCVLHLGDRPIKITLQRALRALSLRQILKLVWRLTSMEAISLQDVEECKQRDLLEKLMQKFAGEFPAFSEVLVKERDLFLCHSLQVATLPVPQSDGTVRPVRVVGVVGISHANGIIENWGKVNPNQIPAILEIPPASISTKICKLTFKYTLVGLTLYGVLKLLKPRMQKLF